MTPDCYLDLLKPVESALKNSSAGQPVGEFRIILRKVNGSLGFTLQSTDQTVLKHTVKVTPLDMFFFVPELYIGSPVFPLLGFYSICRYVQHPAANLGPSCLRLQCSYGNWCIQLVIAVARESLFSSVGFFTLRLIDGCNVAADLHNFDAGSGNSLIR